MVSTVVFLVSLFALASAKPAARNGMVVHETRGDVPFGFSRTGTASSSATIDMRVAIVSSDVKGLEEQLLAVSTPGSPSYGEHLSSDEVNKYLAPSPDSAAAVNSWLESNGIKASPISPAGDWLGFTVTVEKANELLDAKYEVFKHLDTGKEQIRTMSYSIPASLQGKLELVHPTTSFSRPNAGSIKVTAPGNSTEGPLASAVTPAFLESLYGYPTTKATQSSNKLLVTGYIAQYAQTADLKTFLTKFQTAISSSTTFTLATIDGGSNPQGSSKAGIEANLDVQYTVGLALGVPVTFLSVGSSYQDGGLEGFLDTVNWVSTQSPVPTVMTTSYGNDESDISSSLSTKLCNAYMSLGAQGTSILFASGDGGVSGSQSQSCSKFIPTFPSGCPYLTSVGATQNSPETAASFSSGGFSNYFSIPSYQASAVAAYKSALGSTNSGKYSTTGRGFPDVSAQGNNFDIVNAGSTEGVSGTSCSSPTFASVVALLNDQRIASGKGPLGFLNPLFYANPGAFNDITSGSNPGCNTNGFPAKAGWDPVTGLGTPNYSKLLSVALAA